MNSITLRNVKNRTNNKDKFCCDITPNKILCVGRNYVEHIHELGNEIPDEMVVFMKPNSAISTILYAEHQSETLHYESELSFIVTEGKFSAVGFGLDLTKRALQSQLKDKALPWERAKAFDGSVVFSEFVPITNVDKLTLELTINGKLIQQGGVNLMMYKPDTILKELNSFITLIDNDIVMTGTPKGVGTVQQGDFFTGKVYQENTLLIEHSWYVQ